MKKRSYGAIVASGVASGQNFHNFPLTGLAFDPRHLAEFDRSGVDLCLETFVAIAPPSPYGVPFHAHFSGRTEGKVRQHLCFAFITHGNEWGSLPAALLLIKQLNEGLVTSSCDVSILLGNTEAALRDVRFVEEDYNRVFCFEKPADSLERRRAEEVRPVLDSVTFLLDLHQTQTETESAFWTMPWSDVLGDWARAIDSEALGLTRAPGGVFAPGRMCLDEYIRSRDGVGITLEIGTKGRDFAQATRAYLAVRRAIEAHEALLLGTELQTLSEKQPPISWYETVQVIETQQGHRLKGGLGCWTKVQKGELLSAPGTPRIEAIADGRVLFPKYALPLPPEIARVAVPLSDPKSHYAERRA